MIKVFYSPSYALSRHSFDTTRKASWIAASLDAVPITGITLVEPSPCEVADLVGVHTREYVDAIRTGKPAELASSQGFDWDPGLWTMVCATNGGMVAAACAALTEGVSGSLSSGMHHATRGSGNGFCTFNGLVLAANAALHCGARRVLILDFDAHCGGGTASLTAGRRDIVQFDISVSAFDHYDSTRNASLEFVSRPEHYLPAIADALGHAGNCKPLPDLCIYNAGMDPFGGCDVGGLRGISAQMLDTRERMVFSWARNLSMPIAFGLAGGYVGQELAQQQLVDLHRCTLTHASSVK